MKTKKWCKKRLKKAWRNAKINQIVRLGKAPYYWWGYIDALKDVLEEE